MIIRFESTHGVEFIKVISYNIDVLLLNRERA